MKRFSISSRAAILVAAALTSLGATAASAQATTTSGVQGGSITRPAATSGATPDFTCPGSTVCVFQEASWKGTAAEYPTSNWSATGKWVGKFVSLTATSSLTLPWGSFNDNSGSSVVFGDKQTGAKECYRPHSKFSDPPQTNYGYIYVEYGNTTCSGEVPGSI